MSVSGRGSESRHLVKQSLLLTIRILRSDTLIYNPTPDLSSPTHRSDSSKTSSSSKTSNGVGRSTGNFNDDDVDDDNDDNGVRNV